MKTNGLKALLRAAAVGVAATAVVQGAAAAERTLTFAHVLEQDHPYHHMAVKFADEVATRAPGLKVEIYPAGQLGDERTLIEGLQTGSVDIATVTSALTANFVPQFRAFSLPFLAALVVAVAVIAYVPQVTLTVPALVWGR